MSSSLVNLMGRLSAGVFRTQCVCRLPGMVSISQMNTNIPSGETYSFSGEIPIDKLKFQYSRSSGPGGQNVNKVSSKVELRFNLQKADWLSDEIKAKLHEQQRNRITKEGDFYLTSEKTRKQMLNQADCINRLRHMVFEASKQPRPLTEEEIELMEKRKAKRAAVILKDKRHHSMKKRFRSAESYD